MTSPDGRRDSLAKDLFLDAMSLAGPADRRAFLDARCGEDDSLRAEVETLLRHHDALGSYLEKRAIEPHSTHPVAPARTREAPAEVIGSYRLLESIGEGGMGTVYRAEQLRPVRREVALKLIKPGLDTRQVIARFEAERQALAMMDHPGIARVLDAGSTEAGRPYFVMELVRGEPITRFCDEARLSVAERLDLFVAVCRAVQHAHQKGVIHRDLKPSNVLVALQDGVPAPKVIDFGVAKATGGHPGGAGLTTGLDQLVGTPLYMSPEQADPAAQDTDTRSDIYSLGVLLYELLTGTTPFPPEAFRRAAPEEFRRFLREEEPPRPSSRLGTLGALRTTVSDNRDTDPRRLSLVVRGDLDWIVMKALEKDRSRRYPTADALAADILRYRANEPIEACPPSLTYRIRKFARRNRAAIATVLVVAMTMVVGTFASAWQAVRATRAEAETATALADVRRERDAAEAERRHAEEQRRLADDQFAFARQAVDSMYTEAVERWLPQEVQPDATQQEFLRRALGFYERFARAPGRDSEARHQALHASQRVGDIQKRLGRLDLAERAYASALDFARQRATEAPDQPESRRDEASAHGDLGTILVNQGKYAEAEPILRRGLTLQEALAESDPGAENQFALVGLLTALGHLLQHTDRLGEAEDALRRGLALLNTLASEHVDSLSYRVRWLNNLKALGRLLHQMGRLDEADAMYQRGLALADTLLPTRPEDVSLRAATAGMNLGRAFVQWDLHQLIEAEASLRRSIALDEALVADYPAMSSHRFSLADALAELADLQDDRGLPEEADRTFDRARSLLDAWIEYAPDSLPYRNKLSTLEQRRRVSRGVTRGLLAFERFFARSDPLLRSLPMWPTLSSLTRRARSRPLAARARRFALEILESRRLLTAAEFELSSLLPANGGDGSNGIVVDGIFNGAMLFSGSTHQDQLGDINGDGFDDALLVAGGNSSYTSPIVGQVYVLYGRPSWHSAEVDIHSLDGTSGYVINGVRGSSIKGTSAGDINHDGFPDIAVNVLYPRTSSGDLISLYGGQTFVLFGGPTHLAALDLADGVQDGHIELSGLDGTDGLVINGTTTSPGTTSMSTVLSAIGDVNGDHVDDLAIASSLSSQSDPGRVFVVFGHDSSLGDHFPASFELGSLDGSNGFTIPGLVPQDALGSTLAGAGDVNGDGVGDLVLGAMFASPSGVDQAGQAYVVFGRPSFPATFDLSTLNGSTGFTVNGDVAYAYLGGRAVDGAGDVNGDGIDDVLIGASGVLGPDGLPAGATYVIFGRSAEAGAFPPVLPISALDGSNGVTFRRSGGNAASAGDVNGVGYGDIITADYNADPNEVAGAGRAFVIYGGPGLDASLDVTSLLTESGGDGSLGYVLNGFISGGQTIGAAGIGDINGDGLADVSVASRLADLDGLNNNGQAYIIFGKRSDPGAIVSPTSGLLTTEAGGTATFTVSLKAPPTANVSIPVSSGDPSEGTVSASSLTFTPADWNVPQAVTVTGVDDGLVDGDVAFTIVLGPATSADAGYYGLDPADVDVTNRDDDAPPEITSTYSVAPHQNIPDRRTMTSTLYVGDAGTILDLDVRVNITHSYDADLDVYLIAPDGTRVMLFTDDGGSGDNFTDTVLDDEAGSSITSGHAPFSGSYRPEGNLGALEGKNLSGTWTLQVSDDSRRNTGTLLDWSMTVRYAPASEHGASIFPADPAAPTLTVAQAAPILAEARALWAATGADVSVLDGLDVRVADLPDGQLAHAFGRTLTIDDDAAGWGWFLDATPGRDEEFAGRGDTLQARPGSVAYGRMDLLSVALHELGHWLGHDHDEAGVMSEALLPGKREFPPLPPSRRSASRLASVTSDSGSASVVIPDDLTLTGLAVDLFRARTRKDRPTSSR